MADFSNIPLGLKIPTQIPLDVKSYVQNEAALINLGLSNNLAYTYVKGNVFYCVDEGTRYEWREVVGAEQGLMPSNFIYSNNIVSFGITYSNKAFNFFRYYDTNVYSVSNIGSGANIYKDTTISGNSKQFNLRKINVSNSGNGTSILKSQVENSNDISIISKSIKSSNGSIDISFDSDTIDIKVPEPPTTGSLKTFYVNSAYTFPDSNGSIIRPFATFDEARIEYIGSGSITSPQYAGSSIIIQTNSSTAINPTINNLNIKFENNSILTYTGTDLYMFDTEILYPLITKNVPRNDLTQDIKLSLSGKGGISRTLGIGLVRGLGSNRNGLGQINDKSSQIKVGTTKEDQINLYERISYPSNIWDGDTTNQAGATLESIYNTPHKYSLQLPPTVPLLYIQYESISPFLWGVSTAGTINFYTLANTAVKAVNIKLVGNKFNFLVNGQYISTVSATKMIDFPSYYQPHSNRYMIELENSQINCETLEINDAGGYTTTGVDSFLYIKNNSIIEEGNIEIFCKYYINKFLNVSHVTNTVTSFFLDNGFTGSNLNIQSGRYFIDTPSLTYTFIMPKTTISAFLNKSTTPVTITANTLGTLSSFFGNPVISGIVNYVDDAAATAAGLITNSLYFNTTNNAIDKT